jgi:hypothetical protein
VTRTPTRTRIAVPIVCAIVGVAGFLIGSTYTDRVSRADVDEAIIAKLRENCQQDQRFRRQYRVRGVAEQKLLTLFLNLAQQELRQGTSDDPATAQRFIETFAPIRERIQIIPIPNCDEIG